MTLLTWRIQPAPVRLAIGLLLLAGLTACTPGPRLTAAVPGVPGVPGVPAAAVALAPEAYYQQARAQGHTVLRIDAQRSLIRIIVRRGGVLARLGHDHVVASRTVQGQVAPELGRADLQFRLDEMSVDEPALRRAAGFDTQPSAEAIAGTRHNMLVKVLDAERFPLVTLQARGAAGGAADADLQVTITLHGVSRTLAMPVRLERQGGTLTARGSTSLKQTDFGLTPFAVMGGAMAVQDQLELQFDLVASAQ